MADPAETAKRYQDQPIPENVRRTWPDVRTWTWLSPLRLHGEHGHVPRRRPPGGGRRGAHRCARPGHQRIPGSRPGLRPLGLRPAWCDALDGLKSAASTFEWVADGWI